MEEEGGMNLYGFVGNDSINATDLLGLEWKLERDPTRDRATARPEPGDTIRQLAEKIHLSPEDYKKWLTVSYDYSLRMPSVDEPVTTCNSYYEVPNKVYVNDLLTWRFMWWKQWRRVEERDLRHEGFKVVHVDDTLRAQFLTQMSDPDVHGIVVIAHGDSDRKGDFSDAGPDYVTPDEAAGVLHHKLGGFKAIWCWSGVKEAGWRGLVSPTGYSWSHPGAIFIWQSWPFFIQHGFPDN